MAETACPACGHAAASDARFCEACGTLVAKASCAHCGAEARSDARFCKACGKPFAAARCAHCLASLAPDARFCAACGHAAGAHAPAAPAEPLRAAMGAARLDEATLAEPRRATGAGPGLDAARAPARDAWGARAPWIAVGLAGAALAGVLATGGGRTRQEAPPPPPRPAPHAQTPTPEARGNPPSAPRAPADPNATIRGTIRLADGITPPPNATLYIIGRAPGATGPGSLVAVKRVATPSFPLEYELGGEDIMVSGTALPEALNLQARLDGDGDPMSKKPGDVTGASGQPVKLGASGVEIVLGEVLR